MPLDPSRQTHLLLRSTRVSGSIKHNAIKFCAFGVVLAIVIGSAAPKIVFRGMAAFTLFVGLFGASAALSPFALRWAARDRLFMVMISMVTLGFCYIGLSYAGIFETQNYLPLRTDYILRHAFFLILWIPFLLGAIGFWNVLLTDLRRILTRYGLVILTAMAVTDLATAGAFGDPLSSRFQGYTFYMEKGSFALVFIFVYLFYSAYSNNKLTSLAFLVCYFIMSKTLNLGIMFNALTGMLFFLILALNTCAPISLIDRARVVMVGYCILLALLALATAYPAIVANDGSALFRAISWRDNISATADNYFFGVGFGVPYHSITYENMRMNTIVNFDNLDEVSSPIEPLYFNAQHSSLINVLYRLGIVGFLIFLLINITVLLRCFRALRKSRNVEDGKLIHIALLFFLCWLLQISVHVGLESPRFFMFYIISIALAILTTDQSQATIQKPP